MGSETWEDECQVSDPAIKAFTDEELSVFKIDDANCLPRLVAAFALGNPERLSAKDLVFIDEDALNLDGIEVGDQQATGVPDATVRGWHRNFIKMTPDQVRRIAFQFCKSGTKRRVEPLVTRIAAVFAAESGFIERESLSQKMTIQLTESVRKAPLRCVVCRHRGHVIQKGPCLICILIEPDNRCRGSQN